MRGECKRYQPNPSPVSPLVHARYRRAAWRRTVLRRSVRIELTRRIWAARWESLIASQYNEGWILAAGDVWSARRGKFVVVIGVAALVPLNLSDKWALGQVLTILGRYRVNRMANGMDGIVGTGVVVVGSTSCVWRYLYELCVWMYHASTFNGESDTHGTSLAHTE